MTTIDDAEKIGNGNDRNASKTPLTLSELEEAHHPDDGFEIALDALIGAPPCKEWTDYPDVVRPRLKLAFQAMDQGDFEAASPVDNIAYAAFIYGWENALNAVADIVGVDAYTFRMAVEYRGEIDDSEVRPDFISQVRSLEPIPDVPCGIPQEYMRIYDAMADKLFPHRER